MPTGKLGPGVARTTTTVANPAIGLDYTDPPARQVATVRYFLILGNRDMTLAGVAHSLGCRGRDQMLGALVRPPRESLENSLPLKDEEFVDEIPRHSGI